MADKELEGIIREIADALNELKRDKKNNFLKSILVPLIVSAIIGAFTYVNSVGGKTDMLEKRIDRLEIYAKSNVKEINANFQTIADALHVNLIKVGINK